MFLVMMAFFTIVRLTFESPQKFRQTLDLENNPECGSKIYYSETPYSSHPK